MQKIFALYLSLLTVSISLGQEPSPSASVSPTIGLCQDAQACVDQAISGVLISCLAASPSCTRGAAAFALTAGQLADRALADAGCSTSASKQACNLCYAHAKAPLQKRFDFKLFQGFLGNARTPDHE